MKRTQVHSTRGSNETPRVFGHDNENICKLENSVSHFPTSADRADCHAYALFQPSFQCKLTKRGDYGLLQHCYLSYVTKCYVNVSECFLSFECKPSSNFPAMHMWSFGGKYHNALFFSLLTGLLWWASLDGRR